MKIRNGFVSNSSSCSFIIKNLTNEEKTLVDFVKENSQLIEQFLDQYDWYKNDAEYTQKNLIKSAKKNNIVFTAKEENSCIFGDSQGTLIGKVFDYILRDGGSSKSFSWYLDEILR